MNWLMGLGGSGGSGGSGGQKPPNPLIATSGKWLATFIGAYATIFWTPDAWAAWEEVILRAIHARYENAGAMLVFWLLKIGAYPGMFFAVRMLLGITFVSLMMWIMMRFFGGRR